MANNMEGTQFKMYQAMTNDYKAFAVQTLSVTTTAQRLTVPAKTRYAFCQVESTVTDGKAVRYWLNGTVPTSSTGFFRGHADAFDIIDAENIKNAMFIQGTVGTTSLIVTYFY